MGRNRAVRENRMYCFTAVRAHLSSECRCIILFATRSAWTLEIRSMDDTESLKTFRTILGQFVSERKWEQFHAPKNISMALAIEAAELMEHFQWLTVEESRAVKQDPEKLHAIGEEIADVFCYTLALVNELGLDLGSIFEKKMARNRAKYPAAEYRGRFGKDDSRPVSEG